jgi:hypothetical protein
MSTPTALSKIFWKYVMQLDEDSVGAQRGEW